MHCHGEKRALEGLRQSEVSINQDPHNDTTHQQSEQQREDNDDQRESTVALQGWSKKYNNAEESKSSKKTAVKMDRRIGKIMDTPGNSEKMTARLNGLFNGKGSCTQTMLIGRLANYEWDAAAQL